jgi:hypothetical protein
MNKLWYEIITDMEAYIKAISEERKRSESKYIEGSYEATVGHHNVICNKLVEAYGYEPLNRSYPCSQ